MSRLEDAKIAVKKYGWEWHDQYGKKILMPPQDDERWYWTAIWDEDGIPHWLPRFSQGDSE